MRYRELAFEASNKTKISTAKKPLTTAQQQRRQEKNLSTQQRIRDEQTASARKVAGLRAELS